jgi:hypothetical protein
VDGFIIQSAIAGTKGITLQTKSGNCVANEQCDISGWERAQFEEIERRWPLGETRCDPTGIFNCHGLTFAARRTSVSDPNEVRKILDHDGYEAVEEADLLPGDIILYRGDKGDIEHSGMIVNVPDNNFGIPKIISKWGKFKEFVHMANQCPYNYFNITFHRIKK